MAREEHDIGDPREQGEKLPRLERWVEVLQHELSQAQLMREYGDPNEERIRDEVDGAF